MGEVKIKKGSSQISTFNSPFELGIRMVYLLQALAPKGADLQKLVLLDYAIVYSGDLNGPTSLHTPIPYRGGELLSRRELIEQGLYLMSTRGLVEADWDPQGIIYTAGAVARGFTSALTATYLRNLEDRCCWAAKVFGDADSMELAAQFAASGHLWGAELELTSKLPGDLWG